MNEEPDKTQRMRKLSVHLCPQCGSVIDLKELGLPENATGFVTCPKCDWSAPIDIRIVDKDSAY